MRANILQIASMFLLPCATMIGGTILIPGNIVVAVEGNGVRGAASGPYTLAQAVPISLFQYQTNGTSSATYLNSIALPQTASGANYAISAEYGSGSEGTLQLSGNGQYVAIVGYGVGAASFNANPGSYSSDSTNTQMGQSGSIQGQGYNAVPRVVALVDGSGNVNTSTGVYGVFNTNNPRSAYTADGKTIYLSGQGAGGSNTGGVFVTQAGGNSAVSITGNDAGNGTSQDTRTVQIYNNTLYVSSDSKSGATNRDFIGTLGTPGTPPTSLANSSNGPTILPGFGSSTGKLTVTAGNTNGINTVGTVVNLSPENFFFANPSTLYVADSGLPKNTSGTSGLGDGGLQKWTNSNPDGSGTWTLVYTISAGLNLVPNTQADDPLANDTTGLYGLTGMVVGGQVGLFATSEPISGLDQTYLFGVTDSLSATTNAGEAFAQLAAAPGDSSFKGVSFAPTVNAAPEPGSYWLLGMGLCSTLAWRTRRYVRQRLAERI
jgi:hypothetical protein